MRSILRPWPLLTAILVSIVFAVVSFIVLNRFSHAQVVPCTDTWADDLILSLAIAFAVQVFIAPRLLPGRSEPFLAAHVALIILGLWFGLYPSSPLGYSSGKIPTLRGFQIVSTQQASLVGVGEIVLLPQGSAVGINPILLPGDFECTWMSSAEGALDDPASCDTAYVPPDADYDILRLRIRSACGLPDSTAQLKISILP